MPRRARKRSHSGIYHIMLRGINKQRIFHEEADYENFIAALKYAKEICGYQLYAWCLMPNHIHLLMREKPDGETVGQIMKRIGAKYVYWYNLRYERNGPLFQDRFKSEAVDDDGYFLTVLRYIHRNPVKAGITARLEDYPYSSYTAYLKEEGMGLADTEALFRHISRIDYGAWHMRDSGTACLDMDEKPAVKRITDEQALKVMTKASGVGNAEAFIKLPENVQQKAILKMRKSGAGLRQISRLTGMNLARVRKWAVSL